MSTWLLGGVWVVSGLQLCLGVGFNVIETFSPSQEIEALSSPTSSPSPPSPDPSRAPRVITIRQDPLEKLGTILAPLLIIASAAFYSLLPPSGLDSEAVFDRWLLLSIGGGFLLLLSPILLALQAGRAAKHLISSLLLHAMLCFLYHTFAFLFLSGTPDAMYAEWLRFMQFQLLLFSATLLMAGMVMCSFRSLLSSSLVFLAAVFLLHFQGLLPIQFY